MSSSESKRTVRSPYNGMYLPKVGLYEFISTRAAKIIESNQLFHHALLTIDRAGFLDARTFLRKQAEPQRRCPAQFANHTRVFQSDFRGIHELTMRLYTAA